MDLKGNITMEESMMARRKLPFAAIIIPVCVVLLIGIIGFAWQSAQPERLTEDQIASLRSEYPVWENGGAAPLSLEESREACETFVYGEVEGDADQFEDTSGKFYEYTLAVLSDSEGEYSKYHTLTIAADHDPQLKDGMQVVVPVSPWEGDGQNRMAYSANGMFYVTDDGYTIPAFGGREEKTLSGLKVEKLLEALKK